MTARHSPALRDSARTPAERTRLLVDAKADMERPAANGTRPLVVAIANNHIELAMYLVEKGADVNASDNFYKRTPLYAAVEMRNPDFTRESPPAPADARDPVDLIKALLAKGATPRARRVRTERETLILAVA